MKASLPRALAAVGLALVGACSGASDSSTSTPSAPASLRNADEVRASNAAEGFAQIAVGTDATITDPNNEGVQVTVTVRGYRVGGDDFGPWLVTTVDVSNLSTTAATIPGFAMVCAGSTDEGGYQADSTLTLGEDLPAQSQDKGTLNLLLPNDARTQEPVPACRTPAVVRASFGHAGSEWRVPDKLVAQMNARRIR